MVHLLKVHLEKSQGMVHERQQGWSDRPGEKQEERRGNRGSERCNNSLQPHSKIIQHDSTGESDS